MLLLILQGGDDLRKKKSTWSPEKKKRLWLWLLLGWLAVLGTVLGGIHVRAWVIRMKLSHFLPFVISLFIVILSTSLVLPLRSRFSLSRKLPAFDLPFWNTLLRNNCNFRTLYLSRASLDQRHRKWPLFVLLFKKELYELCTDRFCKCMRYCWRSFFLKR